MWNITRDISAFHVRAETEADFVQTVRFAALHNLRLVVKNTGHDWCGAWLLAFVLIWVAMPVAHGTRPLGA